MDVFIAWPAWAQLIVVLAVLVPLAALGAGALLWALDATANRASAWWRRARRKANQEGGLD